MDRVLLGLLFDIFSGLCTALETLFVIFMNIAEQDVKIINFDQLIHNIYVLVAVIMIFYATFNLITYIVSPDRITDKSSGGTKLLINVIVTITLLVFVPTAFSLSRDLQSAILEENIIGKIVLSSSTSESSDEVFQATAQLISRTLARAFITKNDGGKVSDPFIDGSSTSMDGLRDDVQQPANYSFNFIMAIATSAIICLIIFGFLFDVSIRLIKLMFMEIIAPVPIIAYSYKKDMFSKWLKETLSTYASLFIRMALLFFVVYLIDQLDKSELSADNPIIFSFIIIGALLFARQLPQIISEIFGIKMDGNFSLNPMARIREVPLLGSAVQTAGAAVGGAVVGAGFAGREFRQNGGFRGLAQGFRNADGSLNMRAGLTNLGRTVGRGASITSQSSIFGARAGYRQTNLMGQTISQQRGNQALRDTAFTAGANDVARAISGNQNARMGFGDHMFNQIGDNLSEPEFQLNQAVSRAERTRDEANTRVATLEESRADVVQQLSVAQSTHATVQTQLTAAQTAVTNFRANRATAETTEISRQQSIISSQRATFQAQLSESSVNSYLSSLSGVYTSDEIEQRKNSYIQGITNQISQLDAQAAQIPDSVRAHFDQQDSNLVAEVNRLTEQEAREASNVAAYQTQITNIDNMLNNEDSYQVRNDDGTVSTVYREIDGRRVGAREWRQHANTSVDQARQNVRNFNGPFHDNRNGH